MPPARTVSSSPPAIMQKVEKKWTVEEDEILKSAVAQYTKGEKINWQKISDALPGRTNKSCRKRYIHSLDPTLRKGRWTASEDALLLAAYDTYGPNWSKVAKSIPGRTDDQCAKRWRENLDPSIRREEWTKEEDEVLLGGWRRWGCRWNLISAELKGRPPVHCRNRFGRLRRAMGVQGHSIDLVDGDGDATYASSSGSHSPLYEYELDNQMHLPALSPSLSSVPSSTRSSYSFPPPPPPPTYDDTLLRHSYAYCHESLDPALSSIPPPPPSSSFQGYDWYPISQTHNQNQGQEPELSCFRYPAASLSPPDMNVQLAPLNGPHRHQCKTEIDDAFWPPLDFLPPPALQVPSSGLAHAQPSANVTFDPTSPLSPNSTFRHMQLLESPSTSESSLSDWSHQSHSSSVHEHFDYVDGRGSSSGLFASDSFHMSVGVQHGAAGLA